MNPSQDHLSEDGLSLELVDSPTGTSAKPYRISSQDGEIIYIPLSRSSTRLLVTGKESDNAFAVVASSGSQSDPIGFHLHRETHDVFLCLKGNVNVWAGDKCRTMSPGDFASVPPGVVHQYQILGNHSEMVGLIVPGGWEEFFRFIGEPYAGPLWPIDDTRDVFEVLIPKLKAAAEKFDMVPCREQQYFPPSPWQDGEDRLPGAPEPYFLRSGSGPSFLSGGMLCRPLITTSESDGKFSIGCIEGSSLFKDNGIFAEGRRLSFESTHHAFLLTEGVVEVSIGSLPNADIHSGDLVFVPNGTDFAFHVRSRFVKLYAFASGGGIVELLSQVGSKYDAPILPENPQAFEVDRLKKHLLNLGVRII